jgi:hypothetical protein
LESGALQVESHDSRQGGIIFGHQDSLLALRQSLIHGLAVDPVLRGILQEKAAHLLSGTTFRLSAISLQIL